jgi:hypothetical protein
MALRGTYRLPIKFWAGFVGGRIDLDPYPKNGEPPRYGVLYTNYREAKKWYQDVRRVELKATK